MIYRFCPSPQWCSCFKDDTLNLGNFNKYLAFLAEVNILMLSNSTEMRV